MQLNHPDWSGEPRDTFYDERTYKHQQDPGVEKRSGLQRLPIVLYSPNREESTSGLCGVRVVGELIALLE